MPAEQAIALVVRGTDWSETSRITTLFSREFGKVRGLAKGGRRLNSTFDVAFDLLNVVRIVFLRKASSGLDLLTEARIEERFPVLRQRLPALYAGYYIAELLADGTQDYDPHPALFDSAVAILRGLSDPAADPKVLAAAFELAWLRELGYSPRLDACAGCGAPLPVGAERLTFSPAAGGLVCSACAPSVADRRGLSVGALAALRELSVGLDAGSMATPLLSTAIGGEVRQVLGQTVSFVLGRRPRLLGYVDGG